MPSTWLSSAVLLIHSAQAHPRCTMDTECEGALICEGGSCVEALPAAPPVTTTPSAQAVATPTSGALTTAVPLGVAPGSPPPLSPAQRSPTPLVRHSEIMMAGGIVSLVLAGSELVVGAGAFLLTGFACGAGNIGSLGSRGCGGDDAYLRDGLLWVVILTGIGVPLIAIGAHKEPASPQNSATVSPWIARQSGGLSLRIDL